MCKKSNFESLKNKSFASLQNAVAFHPWICACAKIILPVENYRKKQLSLHRFLEAKNLWRDGRVVDYSGLENRRTERYRGFESLSLRRKYSGEDFRKHFTKSVSIVASISYDTFVLYLHVFSEYVRRVPKRPKYSPTVTIWLQKDEPNKNCNQEYVQRLFRVLICCCYSNDYVELCSGIYGSSFHPFRR